MGEVDQNIQVIVSAQIAALQSGMKQAGATVDQFAQKGNTVINNFYQMGNAGEAAGVKMASGAKKAKDALDLAAHSAGVAMPRELKKLISHFETLGPLIAKAFSVFAVIAFLEFLYQLLEQIPKLADKIMGLDDSMKGMMESTAKMNVALRAQQVAIENAKFDAMKVGLDDSRRAAVEHAQAVYNAKMKQEDFNVALGQYAALKKEIEDAEKNNKIQVAMGVGVTIPGMGVDDKKKELMRLQELILTNRNASIQAQVEITAAERAEHAKRAESQINDSRRELDFYKQGTQGRAQAESDLLATIAAIHGTGSEAYRQELHRQTIDHQKYTETIAQQTHAMNADAIRAREERNLTLLEVDRGHIAFEEQLGVISKQKELAMEKSFLDQEHDIRIGSLQRLVEAEKAFLKKDPTRNPEALQKLLEQLYQEQLNYEHRVAELERKSSLQRAAAFRQHFGVISQSFRSHVQGMILGYESFGAAAKGVLGDMVSDFVGMLSDMLMKWIEHLILRWIFGKTIGKSSAASSIAEQAAVGYAAAYASTSAIPIIGPELAPGVAGATFAAIMAAQGMLAFEKGGIVPETGPALVHKGEGVLPEDMTTGLREMISNGGARGGIHFHNQVLDSRGLETVLRRNVRTISKVMRGSARMGVSRRVK